MLHRAICAVFGLTNGAATVSTFSLVRFCVRLQPGEICGRPGKSPALIPGTNQNVAMVFSDPLFIFGFLPLFLLFYGIIAPTFKNLFIFLASLGFYYYGEPDYVWVLLLSIICNYSFAVAIDLLARGKDGDRPTRHPLTVPVLTLGVLFNLGVLLYFKYVDFFIANLNSLFKAVHYDHPIDLLKQVLPLGVSFFTFQGISYLVDVYRGDVRATRSLLKFGTYKILFPQLIAGPIVR